MNDTPLCSHAVIAIICPSESSHLVYAEENQGRDKIPYTTKNTYSSSMLSVVLLYLSCSLRSINALFSKKIKINFAAQKTAQALHITAKIRHVGLDQ
jgi:hypothetical protein